MRFTLLTFLIPVIWLALFVGLCFLEGYLARRESKWPGLVLPILSLCLSLLGPLNVAALPDMDGWSVALSLLLSFLLFNIPTAILLAIYCSGREKGARRRQMDRMNIQDL